MSDYLADKFNVTPASATGDKVAELLTQRGIGDDIRGEVSRLLTDFDRRRFSRESGTSDEMEAALKLAEELITKMERQLS